MRGPSGVRDDTGSWSFSLRFQSAADVLRPIRTAVVATVRDARASDFDARDVGLAVGEALANVRQHAYAGGVGPVDVDTRFDGHRLVLTVRDYGPGLSTSPVIPRVLPGRRAEHEPRGLFVIGQVMNEAEIVLQERGLSLRMVKRINRRAR